VGAPRFFRGEAEQGERKGDQKDVDDEAPAGAEAALVEEYGISLGGTGRVDGTWPANSGRPDWERRDCSTKAPWEIRERFSDRRNGTENGRSLIRRRARNSLQWSSRKSITCLRRKTG